MKKLFIILGFIFLLAFNLWGASSVKLQDTDGRPRGIKIKNDGSQDVNVQDQTTRVIALRFSKIDNLTDGLAEIPTVGAYTIVMKAGHSIAPGDHISVIYDDTTSEDPHPHYFTPDVISVATNTLTLDEPVPYAFPLESIVYSSLQNMNVDGSSTPQIYQLTNAFSAAADLTQLVIHITDATAMDDGTFGGIAALTRGMVFRKKFADNHYENIFNVKTNGELGILSGPNGKVYDTKAPSGIYGITIKISFAGQSEYGVAVRLLTGESIQMLIQDDLTDLTKVSAMAQGHFTD